MKIFRTLLWTAIVAIVVERCRAEFLLVEIDDAPVKMDEVDGIGKEDETLVVKSKLNQNTLVVESDVISEKNSNKIGEVPDETLVVNSKLNPNTLVVESHVKGAKDSADIEEVTDERLVVKSKLNPNSLVVESDVVGAKDSAIDCHGRFCREVTDERLVVKSKLKPHLSQTLVVQSDIVVGAKDSAISREVPDERLVVKSKLKPNTGETLVVQSDIVVGATDETLVVKSKLKPNLGQTLVVQSDIVGAKDSTEIGEVADEKEIRLTPRQCCEKANVPEFCLGNCSPADVMARQGKRINACSKYDTIIEGCFQAAEAKKPLPPKKQLPCPKNVICDRK